MTPHIHYSLLEAAEAFRAIADMLDELIPLFDCGCSACLKSAADNFVQLGEELREIAANGGRLELESIPEHNIRRPVPHQLSAKSIRKLSGLARMQAARLERRASS